MDTCDTCSQSDNLKIKQSDNPTIRQSPNMDIVYFGDDSYMEAIRVSIHSALRHAKHPERLRFHILDGKNRAIPILSDGTLQPWHGTRLVWSRIDFPSLFPDLDWVVSCDGDTLWLDDPENLWRLRDDSLILQASPDVPAADGKPFAYHEWWSREGLEMDVAKCYCMGLSLLNLEKMRETDFSAKCRAFIKAHPDPPVREQTVMCYVARHASRPLPAGWGVFSFWHTTVPQVNLVHYVQDLPWKRNKPNRLMSDIILLWWRERKLMEAESAVLGPAKGFMGCRNRLDYLWRRWLYVAMKPFAPLIDKIPFLRPHFRNARGLFQFASIASAINRVDLSHKGTKIRGALQDTKT